MAEPFSIDPAKVVEYEGWVMVEPEQWKAIWARIVELEQVPAQCEVCTGNVVVMPAEWQRIHDHEVDLTGTIVNLKDERDAWREQAQALIRR